MAIRFDDNLNRRIRRDVKNFNAKIRYNKFKTRGKGMLPLKISTRELKDKYSDKSRKELERQLKLYESFGKRDALELAGPNRLSKWEKEYFEQNREKTKEFYDQEIADLERIIGGEPLYHLRLDDRLINLTRKRDELSKDLNSLSESEIKIIRNVYEYAERSDIVKAKGFRLYLSQLDRTMKNLGYSKKDRDELFNKFNQLSENEFLEMVRNEDYIEAVYDLIDSPKNRGEYQLMADENRARRMITSIQNQADDLIKKYKAKG